jgi:hypothetical protein
MPLTVGQTYTRVTVQQAIGEPNPSHQGKWGTGYTEHDGSFYIFANIGGAGRTGHDYPNEWDGDVLHWCAKTGTHRDQPSMKRLLADGTKCHIFTRHHDRDPFTYHGLARSTNPRSSDPMMLTWVFESTAQIARMDKSRPTMALVLHTAYRTAKTTAGEEQTVALEGVLRRNPALVERALNGHASTQNALAQLVGQRGYTAMSPSGTVDYDLAWILPAGLCVAEVKSLTDLNEVAQMRVGLGQLLDYASALDHLGEKVHRLILAVEREPTASAHWQRVCERAGILLCWGPGFAGL